MAADIGSLEKEVLQLRKRLDLLTREVRRLKMAQRGETPPFAMMKGVWAGADFTEEEIDAAKIRVREFPE